MKGTFKWLTLRAGTLLSRNVSSLFYQLYYREIYREVQNLTQDGAQTVKDAYKLGYLSANESADRQKAIFRLFPSEPLKALEYVPFLWEIYFGSPMQDYTTEWDHSDPERPILKYKIKFDPMSFDIGNDELRDDLPWEKFNQIENKYGSFMAGLLTQCTSYVLKLRDKDYRIILKNTRNTLQGDDYFEFLCQVIKSSEFPDLSFDNLPAIQKNDVKDKELSALDKFIARITENFDIDTLDDMVEDPITLFRLSLSKIIKRATKMSSEKFIDHFTNDEHKFIQVLGFVLVHLTNEWGQFPEKLLEKPSISKLIAHQFNFMRKYRTTFFPISVVDDFKTFFINLFTDISPDAFVHNLSLISSEEMFDLIFVGAKKALIDLNVSFDDLKPTLYEELQAMNSQNNITNSFDDSKSLHNKQDLKDKLYAKLMDQLMLISMSFFSIPTQLIAILLSKLSEGTSEVLASVFKSLRDSLQTTIEIFDELEEINQ